RSSCSITLTTTRSPRGLRATLTVAMLVPPPFGGSRVLLALTARECYRVPLYPFASVCQVLHPAFCAADGPAVTLADCSPRRPQGPLGQDGPEAPHQLPARSFPLDALKIKGAGAAPVAENERQPEEPASGCGRWEARWEGRGSWQTTRPGQ